jgi:phage N-6-adenine-methyltransferase
LDACATAENAKCARYFDRATDGLSQRWEGVVWCNPPYGREIGLWVKKAWESVQSGDAEVVMLLVPSRTDTKWWHRYCKNAWHDPIEGRLKFGGSENSAPFPSTIVLFRNAKTRYETSAMEAIEITRPAT